jgi:hypothetical protein
MNKFYLFFIAILFFSCGKHGIQISDISVTKTGNIAANELNRYFSDMYTDRNFSMAENSSKADILFMLSNQAEGFGLSNLPQQKESFLITQKEGKLFIVAPDERGLLNATYALLEELGCGFYISRDVIPAKKWTGFEGMNMKDAPLTGDRIVFNWHNFLSGCTGWNLEDWQLWIDQANKMRYNGIMVHAYGNNPMFTFEYLGEKKETGYLNNTSSGRDWGNQHVNDVRRMVGGEIFDGPVFGADASFASEENKEKEAIELMQQVFQYAKDRSNKIIFALDFDTWMSNPQNIIQKLPKKAVFEIDGYLLPNPDHPEGFNYFKQVVIALTEMYPQIDQLAVWHRNANTIPSRGTPWMNFSYDKFPAHWKKEFDQIMSENPHLEKGVYYGTRFLPGSLKSSGTFAYGKLIAAIQKARDEVKPELEISSGSWLYKYVPYADVFYPKDVPLIPLDWEVVSDEPVSIETLKKAGANREIYPIFWAHHDDHRYIGRPYTPWSNLSDLLGKTNSKGFGIIHWTTHPLDIYFTSSARQVWKSTENEPLKTTVKNYVTTNFGNDIEKLYEYYYDWVTTGPMFGRETSNNFVDLGEQQFGHGLESWEIMAEKSKKRLAMLNEIPSSSENKYLQYQKGMEEFYISFFENQILFGDAFNLAGINKTEEAKKLLSEANPDETIQKYVDAHKFIGFTRGEKALVFSLNTRWKVDYLNLRQRLGMEPVRLLFSPTKHDPLAQGPGNRTYWIDQYGNWWGCLWEHELRHCCFSQDTDPPALIVEDHFEIGLTTIHRHALSPGTYELQLDYHAEGPFKIWVFENRNVMAVADFSVGPNQGILNFKTGSGNVKLVIKSEKTLKLYGISLINK